MNTDFTTAERLIVGDTLVWWDDEGNPETSTITAIANASTTRIGVSFDTTWYRSYRKDQTIEILVLPVPTEISGPIRQN
jgi:hypothetical protein